MRTIYTLYMITNLVTGAAYIGITKRGIKKRWRDHKSAAKRSQTVLYRAMRKYGLDAFAIEAIAEALDYESLKAVEIMAITQFGTHVSMGGYNLTQGGDGTLGYVPSSETRERMRQASTQMMQDPARRQHLSDCATKQWSDPEFRRVFSESRKGGHLTEEHKRKLSEINTGRIVSDKTRELISDRLRGIPRPQEVKDKIRAAKLGTKMSEEACANMSKARRGKPKSAAHRAAMSTAWDRRRGDRLKGVSPARKGRWQAHLYRDGKSHYLGTFDTPEEAHQAYLKASTS